MLVYPCLPQANLSAVGKSFNPTLKYLNCPFKRSIDHSLSRGKRKSMYQISRPSIEQLMRYFSLDHSGGPTDRLKLAALMRCYKH